MVNAATLNKTQQNGSLHEGKFANFILLNKNPGALLRRT
jgi:imidazolonepropionase-like amidohydrolase